MQRISDKELINFTRELAILLESGIPIIKALELMKFENKKMDIILESMIANIGQGNFLSTSMKDYPKVFSGFYINIIKIGEESGNLDLVLFNLASYLNKKYLLKNKIQKSLIYPSILTISMILVVIFMVITIFPIFDELYRSNGVELPKITLLLIAISRLLIERKLVLVTIIVGITSLIIYLNKSSNRSVYIDYGKINIPFIGNLLLDNYIIQISMLLDLLLKSGISLVESLELVIASLENKYLAKQLKRSLFSIRNGNYLSESLAEVAIFPEKYISTLKIGEETGSLDRSLSLVLETYEHKVENQLEIINIMIEPVLIIIMAIIIGFVLVSLVSPAMNLINII